MMFRGKTNVLLNEAQEADSAFAYFRRLVSLKLDEERGMVKVRVSYSGSYGEAVEITLSDYRNRIQHATQNTYDTSTHRSFFTYHHLKDRGLLKKWFDKARELGSNTTHYA
jgi:hypothetical protein